MTKISRLAEVARRRVRAEEGAEQGFTLIELLVVLLIIGILLAIAIPTFLSVTKTANDTAAQSNLQTALTGAKTWYTQHNQTYGNNLQFSSVDVNISVVSNGNSAGPNVVSYNTKTAVGGVPQGSSIVLADFSSGTKVCWGIVDLTATPTAGGFDGLTSAGTTYVAITNSSTSTCNASAFSTATADHSTQGFSALTQAPFNVP